LTLGLHARPLEYFHSRNIFTAVCYISSVYMEGFYDILRDVLYSNKLPRYFIALEGLYVNKIHLAKYLLIELRPEGIDLH